MGAGRGVGLGAVRVGWVVQGEGANLSYSCSAKELSLAARLYSANYLR